MKTWMLALVIPFCSITASCTPDQLAGADSNIANVVASAQKESQNLCGLLPLADDVTPMVPQLKTGVAIAQVLCAALKARNAAGFAEPLKKGAKVTIVADGRQVRGSITDPAKAN